MIDHVPRVRVIKEWDANYGNECEIVYNHYFNKTVMLNNWSSDHLYKYSEIQFLTPVQYEWRYIGLWDKANWKEVFDYSWGNTEWVFDCAKEYDSVYTHTESGIITFQPLHQLTPKIELSSEEMIEELQRRGKIFYVNGDVIIKDIINN